MLIPYATRSASFDLPTIYIYQKVNYFNWFASVKCASSSVQAPTVNTQKNIVTNCNWIISFYLFVLHYITYSPGFYHDQCSQCFFLIWDPNPEQSVFLKACNMSLELVYNICMYMEIWKFVLYCTYLHDMCITIYIHRYILTS